MKSGQSGRDDRRGSKEKGGKVMLWGHIEGVSDKVTLQMGPSSSTGICALGKREQRVSDHCHFHFFYFFLPYGSVAMRSCSCS